MPHGKLGFESICVAAFPTKLISFEDQDVENKMELVMTSVKKFRSMMAELNIPNNAKPTIFLKLADDDLCKVFTQEKSVIQALVKAEGVTILGKSE